MLYTIIITPKVVEGRLGIHPVSSVIMVLIGGEFFGIIGMILAIPFFSILNPFFD
jgi:predicted PurR-regulated permease PerM